MAHALACSVDIHVDVLVREDCARPLTYEARSLRTIGVSCQSDQTNDRRPPTHGMVRFTAASHPSNLDNKKLMSTILLADDSPHAQRMGERILRDEGFAVVSVTDGETALLRMSDVDPDLVIADVFLPGCDGFALCRQIKGAHRHVRVVLTAGLLETFDEDEARRAGCDAILKKPFEASQVIEMIKPLVHDAQLARGLFAEALAAARPATESSAHPTRAPIDPERVQAAITLALDAALPALIQEITERVLVALGY